jgi:hypothetical protein
MVVNKWTEKIGELEDKITNLTNENKGYETVYKRALLKNAGSKKFDRWYSNLCFREKLILMKKYTIEDWFELELKRKRTIHDLEVKDGR